MGHTVPISKLQSREHVQFYAHHRANGFDKSHLRTISLHEQASAPLTKKTATVRLQDNYKVSYVTRRQGFCKRLPLLLQLTN